MMQEFPIVGNYKVMVQCITYNQSKYIEDTLTGFAMQRTNFPFICCVYDDASTDGEQEILKRWIDNHCKPEDIEVYDHPLTILLMAPDKDNPNCNYAIHLQKVNTWGKPEKREIMAHWEKQCKYIAFCEGDDYWIDSFKLQKQVMFLDNNHDYGMCYTRAKSITEDGKLAIIGGPIQDLPALFKFNVISTLTVCLRTNLILKYQDEVKPETHNWLMGDYPIWLWFYIHSKIYFFNDVTSTYRILKNSASHSTQVDRQLSFIESTYQIRTYYIRSYLNDNKQLFNISLIVKVWSTFRVLIVSNEEKKAFKYFDEYFSKLPLKYQVCGLLMKYSKKVKRYMCSYFCDK